MRLCLSVGEEGKLLVWEEWKVGKGKKGGIERKGVKVGKGERGKEGNEGNEGKRVDGWR